MSSFVKRWAFRLAISICAFASAAGQFSNASAQDAGPVTGGIVAEPGQCQSEPRSVESIASIFANATPPAEMALPLSVLVPLGLPADSTVTNAVTAVIFEAYVCLSAGDYGRFLAHLTDRAVLVEFPWVGEQLTNDDFLAEFASPAPLPAELRQTILAVGNIMSLEDGRSGAIVSYFDPSSDVPGTEVLYLIFTLQDDRWLIDGAINLSPS